MLGETNGPTEGTTTTTTAVMDVDNSESSLIYMDYNATTPLAEEVVAGIHDAMVNDWGNPSSQHAYGARAKTRIETARKQIAEMVKCSPTEVVFTSGGTEGNNMVILSAVRYFNEHRYAGSRNSVEDKPHVLTTNVEHDSILLPLKHLEEESAITYTCVPVDDNGCVRIEDVMAKITDQTCLITVMYANNETGVIMPIGTLGKCIADLNVERRKRQLTEIFFHTDAAQIIGKDRVCFPSLNVHFMTIVGHKFYGPRIGCLIAKATLYPMFFGGNQESGIRPGTENTPMIVGLGIAADLVRENVDLYKDQMLICRERLENKLREAFGDDIVINCDEGLRLANTVSMSFREKGFEGTLVLSRCRSVVASVGAACHVGNFSQVLVNSGVSVDLAKNAIRLSFGRDVTMKLVDTAVADLHTAYTKLKASMNTSE